MRLVAEKTAPETPKIRTGKARKTRKIAGKIKKYDHYDKLQG